LLLPLRVIYEINADWPSVSWPYALIVVALTLYALHLAGPPSVVRGPWSVISPWVKHFAFPVCFILVAVQWPWRIESPVTQGLMRLDANITVEILGWLNIPAMQRGNLIELATGTVGVNEACSGIRSFHSTFMAALFLGELYLFRRRTRLLLVVGGLALAFGFNVVRTVLLSWQANQHGVSAIDKWHDPAGFTISIACFLVLWAIAVFVKRRTTGLQDHRTTEASTTDHGSRTAGPQSASTGLTPDLRPPSSGSSDSQLSTLNSQPASVSSPWSVVSGPVRRYLLAVGCWAICVLALTQLWYLAHDEDEKGIGWTVALPETKPTFQKIELPPRTLELLKYDFAAAAKWYEDDGSEWTVYFCRWEGKSIMSLMSSRSHKPELCFPAAGLKQVSESQIDYFENGGLKLPFRKSTYSSPGQMVYVLYCLWQDGDERRKGMRAKNLIDRLYGPLEGTRRLGQRSLEIVTTGYSSMAEAEHAVRRRLPDLIRIEGHAVPATSLSRH
jgi:exosortase